MRRFPWLESRGAAVALMTDISDGDCGWEGCASGVRHAFLKAAPFPGERLVVLRQCHGHEIWRAAPADAGRGASSREGALGVGDGLMTCHSGLPLGANIADCVPVFICGGDGIVSIVHAGRAGTEQGIAGRAVAAMASTYGVSPSSLFALIGPSAGPCCYQVGKEVLAESVAAGVVAQGDHLDLWQTNRLQLLRADLPDAHIAVDGGCTICQPGYYSYRASGLPARNLAVIMG